MFIYGLFSVFIIDQNYTDYFERPNGPLNSKLLYSIFSTDVLQRIVSYSIYTHLKLKKLYIDVNYCLLNYIIAQNILYYTMLSLTD